MSSKMQEIIRPEGSADQFEEFLLGRNSLFGVRLGQYCVENRIEPLIDPVLEAAFLDLERERPHFVIELGTALVLVCVVDVLQERAVVARREHKGAGLHDMIAAPG